MRLPAWFLKLQPHLQVIQSFFPKPFAWIQNLLGGGDQRVHAFCAVLACVTLSYATVRLVDAAHDGKPVVGELGIVVGGLMLFAGYTYNTGKKFEDPKSTTPAPLSGGKS